MQVQSPPQPGPLTVVVDLPSVDHVRALEAARQLDPWLPPSDTAAAAAASNGEQASCVASAVAAAAAAAAGVGMISPHRHSVLAHLSPAHVVDTPEYQRWMAGLGTHVTHVLCAPRGGGGDGGGGGGGGGLMIKHAARLQVR